MPLVDTAWYIDYGDGANTGYWAVPSWTPSTYKAAGNLVRQPSSPAVPIGNERVFVCVVGGTTGTSEPIWVITRGGKVTDGTVTWEEATGVAGLNGDLVHTPDWTVLAGTAIVLGQVVKSADGSKLMICTAAGTAGGLTPMISSYTPPDNALGISPAANLVIQFDWPVVFGTAGNITLKRTSDNSTVKVWNILTDVGSAAGKVEIIDAQVVLHLAVDLALGVEHYVIWDAGTVKNLAGFAVAAQSSTTAWSFTPLPAYMLGADTMLSAVTDIQYMTGAGYFAGVVAPTLAPLLLDLYPGSTMAYSFRRLRRAYTGSAVRIRRSSDNAELDVGFIGDDFDAATASTHIGGGTGYIVTWYDQSGRGMHVIQATTASQPPYSATGMNGKPTISFNQHNLAKAGVTPANLPAMSTTIMLVAGPTNGWNFAAWNTLVNSIFQTLAGGTLYFDWGGYGGGRVSVTLPAGWLLNAHLVEMGREWNNDQFLTVDGGELVRANRTVAFGADTQPFFIGSQTAAITYGLIGPMSEFIMWSADIGAIYRPLARANVAAYWGTYDSASVAIFAAFSTPPTSARKLVIDTVVRALKAAGIWSKLDALYVLMANDSQAALINWINPGTYNGTLVSTPLFEKDQGFYGSNAAYIDTNFNATTAPSPKFTRDDASLFAWSLSEATGGAGIVGTATQTGGDSWIWPNSYYCLNCGFILPAPVTSMGLLTLSRPNSTTLNYYKNDALFVTGSAVSGAPVNSKIEILRGGSGAFNGVAALAGFGSQLSAADDIALYSAFNNYVTAVLPPLLSLLGPSYSLRKYNPSYGGSAIRVRRSSDNAEQNIGFTGSNLDTASLTSFVGAGNGYVVTWFDQSGAGNNVTQATTASQARIVNAGVIETRNGKPSVYFSGTQSYSGSVNTGLRSCGLILAIDEPGPTISNYRGALTQVNDAQILLLSSGTAGWFGGGIVGAVNNGSSAAVLFGGVLFNTIGVSVPGASGAPANSPLRLGAYSTIGWLGWISECVTYPNLLSTPLFMALYADQATYWGTPILPLDAVGVKAARAYSLRKLRMTYTGAAITIRRSSDNAEQSIGFNSAGDLDTAAIATFVGANSAYVVRWFDQSVVFSQQGKPVDLIQSTIANQPRIVNAGALDVRRGRPTLFMNSTTTYMATATSPDLYITEVDAVFATSELGPTWSATLMTAVGDASYLNGAIATDATNPPYNTYLYELGDFWVNGVHTNTSIFGGVMHQVQLLSNGPLYRGTFIGASFPWAGYNGIAGWYGEFITWDTTIGTPTSTQAKIIRDNQMAYWNTLSPAVGREVKVYTSGSGTWTKPDNAELVHVVMYGAGGGGGGGDTAVDGVGASGGGSGGGGARMEFWFDADDLGATEAFSVGAGGTAGAAGTGSGAGGGGQGGNSVFGGSTLPARTAYGGGGGGGCLPPSLAGGGGGGGMSGPGGNAVNGGFGAAGADGGAQGSLGHGTSAQGLHGGGGGGIGQYIGPGNGGAASYGGGGGGGGGGKSATQVYTVGGTPGPVLSTSLGSLVTGLPATMAIAGPVYPGQRSFDPLLTGGTGGPGGKAHATLAESGGVGGFPAGGGGGGGASSSTAVGVAGSGGVGAGGAIIVTTYTTAAVKLDKYTAGTGTWTKPAGAALVYLKIWGAGGSGGGGQLTATLTQSVAGSGGGGGGQFDAFFAADELDTTEDYSVAAGTTGGAANNHGVDGGVSTFTVGTDTYTGYGGGRGHSFTIASNYSGGGGAGRFGSAVDSAAGLYGGMAGGAGSPGTTNNQWAGGGSPGGGGGINAGTPVPGGASYSGSAGGGGGGACSSANLAFDGSLGGIAYGLTGGAGGQTAGAVIGISGKYGCGMGGTGGGGGAGSLTLAGAGGPGGVPGGGGGGGGSSRTGQTAGAGGNGARGEIWVISFLGSALWM